MSAKAYSQRSDRLQNTNDTLSNNLQTVKAAKTGLESIRKTIADTLDTLKAASQTQAFVAASNITDTATASTSSTQIGMTLQLFDGNGNFNGGAITNNTNLVNPLNAGNGASSIRINGQQLSLGQVFSINGKFLRISGPAATDVPAGDNSGSSTTNPTYVRTVGELLSAVRGSLTNGADNSTAFANYTAGYNSQRIIVNGTGQISFAQSAGTAVNLSAMFASQRPKPANPNANYTSDDQSQVNTTNGYQSFTMQAMDHTLSGGTGGQTADTRRAAAAKSFKLALEQVNQYLKNASVSGTNLLSGDALKVTFDEKGTSSLLQLQDGNNAAMTFTANGLGIANATGGSDDTNQNFSSNDDAVAQGATVTGLNSAMNKLTNALSTLNLGDAQVAQFEATVQNRVDFNKTLIGLLGDAENSLVAADMTQVGARYAALQVQQSFAQTIMSNTKQADQSILQLLR
ncbi:MAG: hypothetical protein ACKOBC_00960 [Hyphomicrobiales bacterium]